MAKRSKAYNEAAAKIQEGKLYKVDGIKLKEKK